MNASIGDSAVKQSEKVIQILVYSAGIVHEDFLEEGDLTASILASASDEDRVEHVYCEARAGGHYVVIFLHDSIDESAADRCDQLVRRAFAPLARDDSWKLVDQLLKPFGR